jgi:phage baseplate assembly protein W
MEFYIKHIGDPSFQRDKLQQDDDLSIMLTQIETILFTRKGSVLGNPEFGANLEDYVYEFRYNDYQIKNAVNKQIRNYVPLSNKNPVNVEVDFTEESSRYVMFLDITIDARIKVGIFI